MKPRTERREKLHKSLQLVDVVIDRKYRRANEPNRNEFNSSCGCLVEDAKRKSKRMGVEMHFVVKYMATLKWSFDVTFDLCGEKPALLSV